MSGKWGVGRGTGLVDLGKGGVGPFLGGFILLVGIGLGEGHGISWPWSIWCRG